MTEPTPGRSPWTCWACGAASMFDCAEDCAAWREAFGEPTSGRMSSPICESCGAHATAVVVATGKQVCGLCIPPRRKVRLLMVNEPSRTPSDSE